MLFYFEHMVVVAEGKFIASRGINIMDMDLMPSQWQSFEKEILENQNFGDWTKINQ